MPKTLIHPKDNRKKVHPLRLAYAAAQNTIAERREAIMKLNQWSEATFYRKVTHDVALTEREARNVAAVMKIPVKAIEKFQKGFAK